MNRYDHRVKFFYRKGNKDARILQKEMPSGCADPLSCTLDEFRLYVDILLVCIASCTYCLCVPIIIE